MVAAHYFWTLHDWYFWDPVTRQFVVDHFHDWHYIKLAWIALFIVSVYLVPFKWPFMLSWLIFRWTTWEAWCYHASMDGPYTPGFLFGLSLSLSIILSLAAALLPFLIIRIIKFIKNIS